MRLQCGLNLLPERQPPDPCTFSSLDSLDIAAHRNWSTQKRVLPLRLFPPLNFQHDVANNRAVAIKRVKKASYKEGVNLGAIKELQALQELQHPNVLAIHDAFVYGERIHLVLEFCDGDLASILRDRCGGFRG